MTNKTLISKALERVADLSYAVVSETTRDYDFSEGYGEQWDIVRPSEKALLEHYKDEREDFDGTDEDFIDDCQYGDRSDDLHPMINVLWPAPQGEDDLADKMLGTCFTVVEIDDEQFFALTGGGMDMSWSIVSAYLAANCLPPAHIDRLPRFAGKKLDLETVTCIEAVKASHECKSNWSQRAIKDCNELYEWFAKD